MQSLYTEPAAKQREAGVFIVITAGILIGVLALAALALDVGRTYRSRVSLQSAVDAAAIGGFSGYMEDGWSIAKLKTQAASIVSENLRLMRSSEDQIQATLASLDLRTMPTGATPTTFIVKGSMPVPTMLLGRLPGMSDKAEVNVSAEVLWGSPTWKAPLMVSLVLDRSSSMSGQPFSDLKAAAADFVSKMNPKDYLSIVYFDSTVKSQYVMPMRTDLDIPAIKRTYFGSSITTGAGTNIEAGLLEGVAQITNMVGLDPAYFGRLKKAIVFMSDGNPTQGSLNSYPNVSACQIPDCTSDEFYKRYTNGDTCRQLVINALAASERARHSNIPIYAIGLGPKQPEVWQSGWAGPPVYQNVHETYNQKSFFMRRIACDPVVGADPLFDCIDTDPGSRCSSGPPGIYLMTSVSSDLTRLFATVAKTVMGGKDIRLIR